MPAWLKGLRWAVVRTEESFIIPIGLALLGVGNLRELMAIKFENNLDYKVPWSPSP